MPHSRLCVVLSILVMTAILVLTVGCAAPVGGIIPSSATCNGVVDAGAQVNADLAAAPEGSMVWLPAAGITSPCLFATPVVLPTAKRVDLRGAGTYISCPMKSGECIGILDTEAYASHFFGDRVGGFTVTCTASGNTTAAVDIRNSMLNEVFDVASFGCYSGLHTENTVVDGARLYSEQNTYRRIDIWGCTYCIWIDRGPGAAQSFANQYYVDVRVNSEVGAGSDPRGIIMTGDPGIYRSRFEHVLIFLDHGSGWGVFPDGDWSGVTGDINFEANQGASRAVGIRYSAPHFNSAGLQIFSHFAGFQVNGNRHTICQSRSLLWGGRPSAAFCLRMCADKLWRGGPLACVALRALV